MNSPRLPRRNGRRDARTAASARTEVSEASEVTAARSGGSPVALPRIELIVGIHLARELSGEGRASSLGREAGVMASVKRVGTDARAKDTLLGAQALRRSWCLSGSDRMRLPVAAKIALHSAGANGGSPGSPTPPGGASLSTMTTSMTAGASGSRATA